jgi:hypothetical protein
VFSPLTEPKLRKKDTPSLCQREEIRNQQARKVLVEVISRMKRTRIVEDTGIYLHAEFTSAVFRFVDNVESFLTTVPRRSACGPPPVWAIPISA